MHTNSNMVKTTHRNRLMLVNKWIGKSQEKKKQNQRIWILLNNSCQMCKKQEKKNNNEQTYSNEVHAVEALANTEAETRNIVSFSLLLCFLSELSVCVCLCFICKNQHYLLLCRLFSGIDRSPNTILECPRLFNSIIFQTD